MDDIDTRGELGVRWICFLETPVNQVSLPQIELYGAGHYSVTSQAPARERCRSDFRLGIWHIVLYK